MSVLETPTKPRGALVPPKVDPLHLPEALANIQPPQFHSLRALGAQIGLGGPARRYAIREGLIKPEPLGKRCDGYRVNRDEALTLLLAAALAIAAGVAIAVMLRGLKNSGLTGTAAETVLR